MIIAWISLCSTMFLIRQAPDPTILVTPLSLSMAGVIMLARLPITPLHTLLVTSPRPMLPWLWKYFILAFQCPMRAFKTKLDCVPFNHQWMLRTERRRRKRTPSFIYMDYLVMPGKILLQFWVSNLSSGYKFVLGCCELLKLFTFQISKLEINLDCILSHLSKVSNLFSSISLQAPDWCIVEYEGELRCWYWIYY